MDVLVVEQIRVEDLELTYLAVLVAKAALEHLGAGGGVRGGVGQDVGEAALLAGLQEPDEGRCRRGRSGE